METEYLDNRLLEIEIGVVSGGHWVFHTVSCSYVLSDIRQSSDFKDDDDECKDDDDDDDDDDCKKMMMMRTHLNARLHCSALH